MSISSSLLEIASDVLNQGCSSGAAINNHARLIALASEVKKKEEEWQKSKKS